MPHIYDFKNCLGTVKETTVNPKGWKCPVTIEYGVAQNNEHDPMLSVVWRIKGTTHVFSIYERRLNLISRSNYDNHFTEALEKFREDYLSWFTDETYKNAEWKYEYQKQYGSIIEPAEESRGRNQNNKNQSK